MKFDANIEIENIVHFIQDYYSKYSLKGAVLGVSGGKDSAVVLALLVRALGKENVVGLTMPCHSSKEDSTLANKLASHYGIRLYNVDLTTTYDTMVQSILDGYKDVIDSDTHDSNINLKPRLRMSTLYYYAAMLSHVEGKPYLVAGTSNKCELYVGYFTKGGDNVHDIATIADYTVDEVIAIGEALGVPSEILHRPPSDGLSNMTDEDKLGVKYSDIAIHMVDPSKLDSNVREKIDRLHSTSRHKFTIPTYRR